MQNPPEDFLCPITRELLNDPVIIVETGHSYERLALLQWWSSTHNFTCPKTGIRLQSLMLTPNWALRSAINSWASSSGHTQVTPGSLPTPHPCPAPPTAANYPEHQQQQQQQQVVAGVAGSGVGQGSGCGPLPQSHPISVEAEGGEALGLEGVHQCCQSGSNSRGDDMEVCGWEAPSSHQLTNHQTAHHPSAQQVPLSANSLMAPAPSGGPPGDQAVSPSPPASGPATAAALPLGVALLAGSGHPHAPPPGWTFFPGLDSPGGDIGQAPNLAALPTAASPPPHPPPTSLLLPSPSLPPQPSPTPPPYPPQPQLSSPAAGPATTPIPPAAPSSMEVNWGGQHGGGAAPCPPLGPYSARPPPPHTTTTTTTTSTAAASAATAAAVAAAAAAAAAAAVRAGGRQQGGGQGGVGCRGELSLAAMASAAEAAVLQARQQLAAGRAGGATPTHAQALAWQQSLQHQHRHQLWQLQLQMPPPAAAGAADPGPEGGAGRPEAGPGLGTTPATAAAAAGGEGGVSGEGFGTPEQQQQQGDAVMGEAPVPPPSPPAAPAPPIPPPAALPPPPPHGMLHTLLGMIPIVGSVLAPSTPPIPTPPAAPPPAAARLPNPHTSSRFSQDPTPLPYTRFALTASSTPPTAPTNLHAQPEAAPMPHPLIHDTLPPPDVTHSPHISPPPASTQLPHPADPCQQQADAAPSPSSSSGSGMMEEGGLGGEPEAGPPEPLPTCPADQDGVQPDPHHHHPGGGPRGAAGLGTVMAAGMERLTLGPCALHVDPLADPGGRGLPAGACALVPHPPDLAPPGLVGMNVGGGAGPSGSWTGGSSSSGVAAVAATAPSCISASSSHEGWLTAPIVAFNTNGWLKTLLQPMHGWVKWTAETGKGLFVRNDVLLALVQGVLAHVQGSQAAPVQLAGWTFFHGLDSLGGDVAWAWQHAGSPARLAVVAGEMPGVIAFNTDGYLKSVLAPRRAWARVELWRDKPGSGLYVHNSILWKLLVA